MTDCRHCGNQIHPDGDVWADNSGGDVCGWNGGNEPHEPGVKHYHGTSHKPCFLTGGSCDIADRACQCRKCSERRRKTDVGDALMRAEQTTAEATREVAASLSLLEQWADSSILPSDTDRDAAITRITQGHVEGRLTQDDMDARISYVMAARGLTELRTACRGLPEPAQPTPGLAVRFGRYVSTHARVPMLAAIPTGILGIILSVMSAPVIAAPYTGQLTRSLGALNVLGLAGSSIAAVLLVIIALTINDW